MFDAVTVVVAVVIAPDVLAYATPATVSALPEPIVEPPTGVSSASSATTTPSRFAPDASVKTTCAEPDAGFVRLTVALATYASSTLTISNGWSWSSRPVMG
jgi:hypothetical protein